VASLVLPVFVGFKAFRVSKEKVEFLEFLVLSEQQEPVA
jgi:hypothetical protein